VYTTQRGQAHLSSSLTSFITCYTMHGQLDGRDQDIEGVMLTESMCCPQPYQSDVSFLCLFK
jgi:hypothetical protein